MNVSLWNERWLQGRPGLQPVPQLGSRAVWRSVTRAVGRAVSRAVTRAVLRAVSRAVRRAVLRPECHGSSRTHDRSLHAAKQFCDEDVRGWQAATAHVFDVMTASRQFMERIQCTRNYIVI